jgi:hypothetical protein
MIGRLYQPSVHTDQRLKGGEGDGSAVGMMLCASPHGTALRLPAPQINGFELGKHDK